MISIWSFFCSWLVSSINTFKFLPLSEPILYAVIYWVTSRRIASAVGSLPASRPCCHDALRLLSRAPCFTVTPVFFSQWHITSHRENRCRPLCLRNTLYFASLTICPQNLTLGCFNRLRPAHQSVYLTTQRLTSSYQFCDHRSYRLLLVLQTFTHVLKKHLFHINLPSQLVLPSSLRIPDPPAEKRF